MKHLTKPIVIFVLAAVTPSNAATREPMVGFTRNSEAIERSIESRFDAILSPGEIRSRLRVMTSAPNQVGAPHNKKNAEVILQQFRTWGWDAHIESFDALYPTPRHLLLELVEPRSFQATLTEPPIVGDAATNNIKDVTPGYVVYGADGDVNAALVYVNYGMPEDYAVLAQMGISVRGKVVIARYGAGWRGLKPKLASEHGAIGCIIYSDPADDGYGVGDVYPKGGWRPDHGIQRGSVIDLPIEPGDPVIRSDGLTDNPKRLPLSKATTIMKIPTLPISYADASHFLAALTGPVAPIGWRGALPLTYHVGPGRARVHLLVQSNWSKAQLYNVIATLKGNVWPDQWIIRGNNHDAWVYGAFDPFAAHSAMMEEARALGTLFKTGWRPKRSIVYASWDGENAALLGSTNWAEMHAGELRTKAALYINSGLNGRGVLGVKASHSADRLIDQTSADVADPETHATARDRAIATLAVRASASEVGTAREFVLPTELPVGDLGAGSDYTPFLEHLGIASVDLDYGGEDQEFGIYQSAYDTYSHYLRFGDPTMLYGVALAATAGRLVLRAADADVFPFEFSDVAKHFEADLNELHLMLKAMEIRSTQIRQLRQSQAFELAAAVQGRRDPPADVGEVVPNINLAPLDAAIARLKTSAQRYDTALRNASRLPFDRLTQVNSLVSEIETELTDSRGLPGRPWYKHLFYAPGLLSGYAAKTLPGIRESIEGRRWQEAREYIVRTTQALTKFTNRLDEATGLLNSHSHQ